jgi:hypothetical protein
MVRELTAGKAAQMLREVLKANWQVFLAVCVLCAGLAAACLLKGEDSTYYGVDPDGSFATHGVSAYKYYFVWPKSQRETVAQNEEFVAILQSMGGGLVSTDLSTRMQRNIILALFFGAISATLAIALWVVNFRSGDRR